VGDVNGIITGNALKRLIIVRICPRNGFLPVGILIYKADKTSGDYHGDMNHTNFEKWISERVIPNLPLASVIMMDNECSTSLKAGRQAM
jgi:hypothetical protein